MPKEAPVAPREEPSARDASRPSRWPDFLPRVLSSVVLAAAALFAVWMGGETFAVIWLGAAYAVAYEWQNLIRAARPLVRLTLAALALVLAEEFARRGGFRAANLVIVVFGLLTALAAGPSRRYWAFAGIVYAGALIISVNALNNSAALGAKSIFWLFAVVWGTDVFAYFGGRLIGGPKILPKISPSKTWSGTLLGLVAGALLGVLAAEFLAIDSRGLGALAIFGLGLFIALVSQGGDVFESTVKRWFGVKDSSFLIPGHGGFMDRLDGFVAAATFAALAAAAAHLL
jgi:phosphatidate cytidylyltransferase